MGIELMCDKIRRDVETLITLVDREKNFLTGEKLELQDLLDATNKLEDLVKIKGIN